MEIRASQFHLIERLLNVSKATVHPEQDESKVFINLFERCKDIVREVIAATGEKNRPKYAPFLAVIDGQVSQRRIIDDDTSLMKAIKENRELVRNAVAIYRLEANEELYTDLLDKTVSEMSGYEFMLLFTRSSDKAYYDKWIDTAER